MKSCPFCGKNVARAARYKEIRDDDVVGGRIVICDFKKGGCGSATGWHRTEQQAIKAWDEREGG